MWGICEIERERELVTERAVPKVKEKENPRGEEREGGTRGQEREEGERGGEGREEEM